MHAFEIRIGERVLTTIQFTDEAIKESDRTLIAWWAKRHYAEAATVVEAVPIPEMESKSFEDWVRGVLPASKKEIITVPPPSLAGLAPNEGYLSFEPSTDEEQGKPTAEDMRRVMNKTAAQKAPAKWFYLQTDDAIEQVREIAAQPFIEAARHRISELAGGIERNKTMMAHARQAVRQTEAQFNTWVAQAKADDEADKARRAELVEKAKASTEDEAKEIADEIQEIDDDAVSRDAERTAYEKHLVAIRVHAQQIEAEDKEMRRMLPLAEQALTEIVETWKSAPCREGLSWGSKRRTVAVWIYRWGIQRADGLHDDRLNHVFDTEVDAREWFRSKSSRIKEDVTFARIEPNDDDQPDF